MSPATFQSKLAQMRSRLTRWMLVHGLARWLLISLAILMADMVLDRLFKMDFAQRLVMLVIMAALIGAFFAWRVIRPLLFRASDAALLYEVERQHPELNEAVLSGYQLALQTDTLATGMSPELAQLTIQQGIDKASGINFGDALDAIENRRDWALLLTGLALVALLAVGVSSNKFLGTWFNRNILLTEDQWPQQTYLEIEGAVDGRLTVSRGADHRQLVVVREDSAVTDVSVTLEIENPGGRSNVPMKPTGKRDGREHLFTFHNVSSPFRFRALAGDEVTRWIQVELVEPPSIIEMELTALLPEYTGQESEPLVGNGPHAVLRGSQLAVNIKTNKPLKEATLSQGDDSLEMQAGESAQEYSILLPQQGQSLKGGEYLFQLSDTDGIPGLRKSKFRITIKEDKPPQVRATLLGISGLVVPRAILPTSYQAADEYGLSELAFDCSWTSGEDESENAQLSTQQVVFASLGQDGPLQQPVQKVNSDAVLSLEPLKLAPGMSFRFSVIAMDNFPDPPNTGRSQEFLLRVVTEEELRSDLLRREIEQREAFDQAYQKQLALATEIQAIGARQRPDDVDASAFAAQREADLISAVREQKTIGTSIARVADRFEDFLVEVKNNRLDEAENEIAPEQRIETRFDQKIIQPIRKLDEELIALAARQMDDCRINAQNNEELTQSLAAVDGMHQQILVEMSAILQAMNDSENFQGIINDILEIKRDTEMMKKKIGEQQGDDGDIFDDKDIFDQ